MSRTNVVQCNFSKQTSLTELMEQFIFYKRAQGISERTLEDYDKTFRRFKKHVNSSDVNLNEVKSQVLKFLTTLSGKAPATYNVPYSNLNTFFNWIVEDGYLEQNPLKALGLKKRKDEGRARHIDEDIIKKLFDVVSISTYAGLRDYAILIFTLDTGIRPKEAFSLNVSDIDFIHNTVTIRKEIAKTRTARMLPLSLQTVEVIRKLVAIKPQKWGDNLFFTVEGYPMTVNRWEHRLQAYSKKIGFRITPYDLRHTFSIMFLRNGGNVFALQHELGHADISMTRRYVNLADNDIKEQHFKASPVNNFIKRTTRIQKIFK